MRTQFYTRILSISALLLGLSIYSYAQPANDNCTSLAASFRLTSATTCSATQGTLQSSTASSPIPPNCVSGTQYDIWYVFQAVSTTHTVTLSNQGQNVTNPQVQIIPTCGSTTSLACGTTSATATGLTVGADYFIRISNVGTDPTGSGQRARVDVCVTHPVPPPANDDCAGAISLTPAATCSNTAGTMISATASSGVPQGCFTAGTYFDVWYRFNATQSTHTVTLSSLGAGITGSQVQVYGGSCGALSSIACGTTTVTAPGLTIGSTYYIRVSSSTAVSANGTFNICVTNPASARVDYSRSYINVTKGSTGGTVNPGDTLEMRYTLVVSSRTVDSLAIFDTLYNTRGIAFIPGSLALRTNEGKVYRSFTDAFDTDAGWISTNGADTLIRINFGTNATNFARGQLSNTSRPSVFGNTCIIMVSYRVRVYAGFNSLINFKTGRLTYRDQTTTVMNSLTFATNNLRVYESPGLCPNAVSATNALGAEFNGTFGTPGGGTITRNRGTTPYTSYQYTPFTTAGGPQDYYYGIANNTSSRYTTQNTWTKPDANGYRVFSQWDITGDHTGASNTALGNPACDTTLPVSPSNPCGYMLVINSAYRADTAFTYTVNNLCPNTYYEISAWLKNICYKCGCDSTGAGSGSASYIPTATGDSSGVRPNIAFDVNGVDFYTTGDIRYMGVGASPTLSDGANQWVKRGFVYLTGPSETSFTLTLRNNAPGGGGNDWALDDINVTTCLPNMQYSPSLNPTTCENNPITINDTIRSYFNNYNHYQWQRSTDNGATWTDLPGASGSATPVWNSSAWEYVTTYTVPVSNTQVANNGDRYRVVVATTSANLSNGNCQVTDGISIINLNVLDCGIPLKTQWLSFNGKITDGMSQLIWTTSREEENLEYEVQRSIDGQNFTTIGSVRGHGNFAAETNRYLFNDPQAVSDKAHYRIIMKNSSGKKAYSRTIVLWQQSEPLRVGNLQNPFSDKITIELYTNTDSKIDITLLNSAGMIIRQQQYGVLGGTNNISMNQLGQLPQGVYILKIQDKEKIITRKLVKH